MSDITLTEGDFGAGATVTYGPETIYLPDRQRPGLMEAIPLAEVAEMDRVADDRSGQVKQAMKLSASGFLTAGPIGLAAGLLAVRTTKDVVFTVVLNDGRKFSATTDAVTYASLHDAQVLARSAARLADAPSPADDIIAKYVSGRVPIAAPAPIEENRPAPEPIRTEDRMPLRAARPTFGKRRSS